MTKLKCVLFFLVSLSHFCSFSSNNDIKYTESFFNNLKNYKYSLAKKDAKMVADNNLRHEALELVEVLYYAGQKEIKLNMHEVDDKLTNIIQKLKIGYFNLYTNPYSNIAFKSFNEAFFLAKKIDRPSIIKFCLISILEVYNFEISQSNDDSKQFLEKFRLLVRDKSDQYHYKMNLLHFYLRDIFFDIQLDHDFFIEFDLLMTKFGKNHPFWPNYYSSKGVIFEDINTSEEAFLLHKKAIEKINDEPYLKFIKFRSLIRLSEIMRSKGRYLDAITYIHESEKFIDLSDTIRGQYYTNLYLSKNYYEITNHKKAYFHLEKATRLKSRLNYEKNTLEIAHLNVKYKTQEKELKLIKETQKTKQNQNIAIGLGGTLALGSLIAFLLFKNTKRKQKLAEQQKELETQKLENVLKDQELTAIDAMIEGQEKERQRIANDLHDDLGGLMATVKLHFNALKEKQTPELYTKTNQLIDEAYEKVRTVAHAKNSGVIAKQGLLKAIRQMAQTISAANTINIDVIDHGLDNRLENSLELTIFRIIQELVTNIIKHAQATEASIHITNHEDSLNIMVEDNGKGFNPSQVTKTNKGMGISSIDKRVAHLEGTMTIESEYNQGTTIIIDIPI